MAKNKKLPGGKILSMVCTGCKSEAEFYVTFYDRELVCVTASGKIKRNESCPVPSTRSVRKTLNIKTLKDLAKAIAENNTLYPQSPAGYGCSCKDCDESTNACIHFEDGTATYDVDMAFRKAFPQCSR